MSRLLSGKFFAREFPEDFPGPGTVRQAPRDFLDRESEGMIVDLRIENLAVFCDWR
jgi:hypothetical protein